MKKQRWHSKVQMDIEMRRADDMSYMNIENVITVNVNIVNIRVVNIRIVNGSTVCVSTTCIQQIIS